MFENSDRDFFSGNGREEGGKEEKLGIGQSLSDIKTGGIRVTY